MPYRIEDVLAPVVQKALDEQLPQRKTADIKSFQELLSVLPADALERALCTLLSRLVNQSLYGVWGNLDKDAIEHAIVSKGRMLGQRSHPRLQKGKLKREKMAREGVLLPVALTITTEGSSRPCSEENADAEEGSAKKSNAQERERKRRKGQDVDGADADADAPDAEEEEGAGAKRGRRVI